MQKSNTFSLFSILFFLIAVSCTNKNNDILPDGGSVSTVTDINGNVYKTVKIGNQTWMAENLKVTKYRNGDLIGTTSPATKDISKEISPKYQWPYDGNETNVAKYGRLYTWYAASDTRNIAPVGWHLPTATEWTTLTDYVNAHLGTSQSVVKALAASTDWYTYTVFTGSVGNDLSKNNSTGFSLLPAGMRGFNGEFYKIGSVGVCWSSSEYSTYDALGWGMNTTLYSNVVASNSLKMLGYNVRCVKD